MKGRDSAMSSRSRAPSHRIASVAGVIAGSAAYAMATGRFRWEGVRDAEDTANHIVGGLLMGFGGITALGCTIGQGISGFSTLAVGSMVTFVAIVAGSAATMKYQYWRVSRSADHVSGHGDESSARQPPRHE